MPPVEPLPAAPLLDSASLEAALFGEGEREPQVPVTRRLPEGTPATDPGRPPGRGRRGLIALGVVLLVVVVGGAAYAFLGRDDSTKTPTVDVRSTTTRPRSTTTSVTTTTVAPTTTTVPPPTTAAPPVVTNPPITEPPPTDPPVTEPPTIPPTTPPVQTSTPP